MKNIHIMLCGLVAGLLCLSSCKETEEDEYLNFMDGDLTLTEIPQYVGRGQEFTVVPSGITEPSEVGYYFNSTWDTTKDTTKTEHGSGDGAYTFETPTSLGDYTLNCVAFAEDYYTSQVSIDFTVINPELNTTVTDTEISVGSRREIDPRDNNYIFYSDKAPYWTKHNLGYAGCGVSYYNSPIMDQVLGRFYTWHEAQTVCPDGWRLPTDQDFLNLAQSIDPAGSFAIHETFMGVSGAMMVNAKFLDERMWEYWPAVNLTNSSGFCAIPAGYALSLDETHARFVGFNQYAAFWTADEEGENGFYRYLYVDKPNVMIGKGNKESFRASVRCVK